MSRPITMYIDPASKSTGWCVIDNGSLIAHGTIVATPGDEDTRYLSLYRQYHDLMYDLYYTGIEVKAVKFECIVWAPRCHPSCKLSIAAIMVALAPYAKCTIPEEMTAPAWQSVNNWSTKAMKPHKNKKFMTNRDTFKEVLKDSPLVKFIDEVESLDELSALGMGFFMEAYNELTGGTNNGTQRTKKEYGNG